MCIHNIPEELCKQEKTSSNCESFAIDGNQTCLDDERCALMIKNAQSSHFESISNAFRTQKNACGVSENIQRGQKSILWQFHNAEHKPYFFILLDNSMVRPSFFSLT